MCCDSWVDEVCDFDGYIFIEAVKCDVFDSNGCTSGPDIAKAAADAD